VLDVEPRNAISRARHLPPTMARLGRFLLERFPPESYGPLIVSLVAGGWTAASLAAGQRLAVGWNGAVALLAVTLAFLQLRTLDELRDEEVDRLGRPGRPLPRGLVTVAELHALAVVSAFAGVVVAASLGVVPFAWYAAALVSIWFLGLGLPSRLGFRGGIVWTALLHSVLVPEVLLFTWAAADGPPGGAALAAAIALVWGAGLAMEVGRKTLTPGEERPGVETYSGELGRRRALAFACLPIAAGCLGAGGLAVAVGSATATWIVPFTAAGVVPLLILGLGDRIGTAALRSASSALVLCLLLWPLVISLGVP
jgi:4-hydroxybenzoate polyprenyltransferase